MRRWSWYLKLAAGLYLTFGTAYQLWTCATWSTRLGQDGQPPDIPCAGMPWTLFTVALWPIESAREIQSGHPIAGAIFALGSAIVAGVALLGWRAWRLEQPNAMRGRAGARPRTSGPTRR